MEECSRSNSQFEGDELSELRLYPVTLQERPRSQRGRLILAEREEAVEILERLKRLSEPYGTEIQVKGRSGYSETLVIDSLLLFQQPPFWWILKDLKLESGGIMRLGEWRGRLVGES